MLLPFFARTQNSFLAAVKSLQTKEPLAGSTVSIKNLHLVKVADSAGIIYFNSVPAGNWEILVTSIGYKEWKQSFLFPLRSVDTIQIELEPGLQELDEVTIKSTRSNRSIRNTATRVEVITNEEVEEEASMRPGDIKMLLAESTGIQTQQTSATSANASIRIQGLDGRYTQILKDGFPVYAGAATGLGLLQTPPLDLKQVEVIKGASSTLYGGGAIAGLINLISKEPTEKRTMNFLLNGTSAGGADINGYYSERFKHTGVTFYMSRNSNKAFAPGNTLFTAIPRFERYTINPKLFLYLTCKTTLSIGVNTSFENRLGGDIQFINNGADSTHTYFERNKSNRLSTQITLKHQLTEKASIEIKNSVGYFNRVISSNGYSFNGTQYNSFTEASYAWKQKQRDWVAGVNVLTDQFKENRLTSVPLRDYNQTTLGGFVQNTWNASKILILETGVRGDYVVHYGFVFLPRISLLLKIAPSFNSRIGAGLGYKAPTIFTEESEKLLYKNVLPISPDSNTLENSYGVNWDLDYKTLFDKFTFSINQLFFFTRITRPLFNEVAANGYNQLRNIPGHIVSRGAETNIKLGYDNFGLYLGYTLIIADIFNNGQVTENPLTPRHRLNAALVYEVEGKWKFGSELYYFSQQKLSDGSKGRDYWLGGFLAEKIWKHISLFINFENLGNIRQTRFEDIYTGTISNPTFKDIYAPLEGFVVNGGVKIKL